MSRTRSFDWRIAVGAALTVAIAAEALPARAQSDDGNEWTIVDCRLAPKVRKLGMMATYQVPGQLIRLPAKVCSIRGGEYTLDDPGSYASAIKRWTGPATQGDREAQTNLAILYERSNPPDFAAAASWYQKAADQGYAPAEIALGQMYEQGRGVAKDEAAALNLYRKAAGINGNALEFIEPASGGQAAPPAATPQQQSAAPAPTAPSIEIDYPLATASNGQTKLRLRAGSSTDTVVGRVISSAGIDHATADGKPLDIDSQGYFILPYGAVSKKSSVKLTASDRQGHNAEVDVAIQQASDTTAAPTAPKGNFGNYYALIIGNSKFEHWDLLENATKDAQSVDQVLRTRYGFQTTLLQNATKGQMLEALYGMVEKLTENDNLLIYYAGHGQLYPPPIDEAYWIPIDGDAGNNFNYWVSDEDVTKYLKLLKAKHVIIIADSCYAGAFSRTSIQRPKPNIDASSRSQAIEALSNEKVRTVMTSGGVQPVLDSGADGHSVFAAAMIRVLAGNDQVLEANRLFDALSPEVVRSSEKLNYKQVPTYRALPGAGHEGGDFLFVPVSLGG